ncbi:MAG: EAL domain-containing protein [Kangiellaceae bacterium]|nr:EAL domain-containing protein [Kangiellaceae bacterium]MCW8999027.1 EAL domain-containing protein [Kangiellaceae bacterium]MCW9015756.1 EAL domain-containing protein [Kangiellaceae bacterium]
MKRNKRDDRAIPPINQKDKLSLFEKHRALEGLLEFVEQVNQFEQTEDVIWHLAHHTIKALNFEDCVIYLLDQHTEQLVQTAAFGPKNPVRYEILNPITLEIGRGIVGKAAQSLESIRIANTSEHPEYIVDDQMRYSELAVPISFQGKLIGVIDSEHSMRNFFTPDHQRYVEILASVLASKIRFESNTITLEKTIDELERSKQLSEVFLKISELTHNSRSTEEFYLQLHQLIAQQVRTHSFFVVLWDKESNSYSFPYIHDEQHGGRFDLEFDNNEMKNSLVSRVIKSQKPYLADYQELQRRYQLGQLVRKGDVAQSWLAVPFEVSSTTQGAIALQSYDKDIYFEEKDLEFLNFLSRHVSTAIERKIKDQKLHHQALHDPVTGLANRSLFVDRIEHAFSRQSRKRKPSLAVFFIDFDNFKQINDSFGHQVGDEILKQTAFKMQAQLRESDTLARIGGDEFAILLEDLESTSYAIKVAQRILSVMHTPIEIKGTSIYATISIGIAFNDENCNSKQDLMKNADHAMYHAKNQGKNNIQVYESSLHHAVVYARQLLHELEIAIEQKQIIFHYQPIVNLSSGKILGFEALMRWHHPEKGIIQPSEFIGVAEQYDLVKVIDKNLLDKVAKTIKKWQSVTREPVYISINISAQRFVDSKLVDDISEVIEKYQLAEGSLLVELTEHVLMENISKARLLFHRLKALGIKISLDDFGTGYSSLSYLNQLPFDIIKVDRSFVSQINESNRKFPIISTIIALADALEIDWVAEGIETSFQLETLKKLDCHHGQGYFLAKPLPESEAVELLIKTNN